MSDQIPLSMTESVTDQYFTPIVVATCEIFEQSAPVKGCKAALFIKKKPKYSQ